MPGNTSRIIWLWMIFVGCLVFSLPASAQEQETEEPAVVHAVLFYSPTCPHCHEAINNVMIPLMEKYGEQLAVLAIDTTTEAGSYLFTRAITYYQTPQNRQGVPTLVIEDTVLVGALEIENVFPEMIEAGLAAGGNNWPNFPGMAEIVMELTPAPDSAQAEEAAQTQTPVTEADGAVSADVATAVPLPSIFPSAIAATEGTTAQSIETIDAAAMSEAETASPPDAVGLALGWMVLLGLLAVLLFCVWQLGGRWAALTQAGGTLNSGKGRSGLMGALMAIGLVVSGYLAYVEMTHVTAVCGPVGECNIVQSSPYAHIFGIPIAVLGLLFYISVAGLWLLQRVETLQRLAVLALVGLAFGGTLFSLYLTTLELLVIGAVCMWCLTSAVATGLICLLVTWWALKRPLPPDPQWQAS